MIASIIRCALLEDLSNWTQGVHTAVGERGVTLSGGQQQRIGVARALYGAPRLLIADDPFSAVDARTQATLLATFREFAKGGGTEGGETRRRSILCSLNQRHHLALFDRVVHSEDGVVVAAADASVDELTEGAPTATALATIAPVDISDSPAESAPVAAPADATTASSPAVSSSAATSAPVASASTSNPNLGSASTSNPNLGSASTSNPKLGGREAKSDGDLASGLVSSYLRAMGPLLVTTYTLLLLCSYAAYLAGDLTLTAWMTSLRHTNSSALELDAEMRSARRAESLRSLIIYVSCSAGHVALLLGSSAIWALGGVRASRTLHADTVGRLALAPLWWYAADCHC